MHLRAARWQATRFPRPAHRLETAWWLYGSAPWEAPEPTVPEVLADPATPPFLRHHAAEALAFQAVVPFVVVPCCCLLAASFGLSLATPGNRVTAFVNVAVCALTLLPGWFVLSLPHRAAEQATRGLWYRYPAAIRRYEGSLSEEECARLNGKAAAAESGEQREG